MAESVARSRDLRAAGIDFNTADINEPWHKSECAVIQVNNNPGIALEEDRISILQRMFPTDLDGRTPCSPIVGGNNSIPDARWPVNPGQMT